MARTRLSRAPRIRDAALRNNPADGRNKRAFNIVFVVMQSPMSFSTEALGPAGISALMALIGDGAG